MAEWRGRSQPGCSYAQDTVPSLTLLSAHSVAFTGTSATQNFAITSRIRGVGTSFSSTQWLTCFVPPSLRSDSPVLASSLSVFNDDLLHPIFPRRKTAL
jgi:hypothetical protein